jgi:hypothetical protein
VLHVTSCQSPRTAHGAEDLTTVIGKYGFGQRLLDLCTAWSCLSTSTNLFLIRYIMVRYIELVHMLLKHHFTQVVLPHCHIGHMQAMMVDQQPLQGWEDVTPIAQTECDAPVVSIDYSPECECKIDVWCCFL